MRVDQLRSRGMVARRPYRQETTDFTPQAILRGGSCDSALQLRLDPLAHQRNALMRIEEVAARGKSVDDRVQRCDCRRRSLEDALEEIQPALAVYIKNHALGVSAPLNKPMRSVPPTLSTLDGSTRD
jgi:hypothetical protein